jgi:hypothetical protein
MPRCKKANPIRHTYLRDLKRRVIYQAFTLSLSSTVVSISLDIPLRVVQRICHGRNWRTIGEVCVSTSPYLSDRPQLLAPLSLLRCHLLAITCEAPTMPWSSNRHVINNHMQQRYLRQPPANICIPGATEKI